MSVQYIHAKDGYEFRITAVGKMVRSIRNKYVDMPQSQYKRCAPKTWMTSGYIEEVRIEQNETVQNVSIWKNV